MKTKPDKIIEYGLIFLIIFTPLAFGSVHIWAYTIVEVVVLLLLLTWLLASCSSLIAHRPLPHAPCSQPLALPFTLLLFLCLILFQMVPMPATIIKHLSPNTYDLYQQTLGNSGEQGAGGKEQEAKVSPLPPAPCPSPLADSASLIAKNHDPRAKSQEQGAGIKEQGLRVKDQGTTSSPMPPAPYPLISNPYPLIPNPLSSSLAPRSSSLAPRSLSIYSQATKTEFLKFFVYVSVFFLIITTMTTFRQIRRLVLTIIFTGTGVAFLALCQMLGKSDKIYGFWQSQYKVGSYGGPFINANHLAGYLEMVIPLALGFLLSREVPGIIRAAKNWKQRLSLLESWLAKNVLLIFVIVLMSSALFISVSRGGILSFVFSLGLFSLLLGSRKSQKGKRKMILLISGLIFIFLLWMGVGPVVTKLATLANPRTASAERLRVWKDTLILARDFPVFGVGLGNFQTIYPKYKTITTPTLWEHAHNDYVEMLADTGWVGLLLFFGGIWFLLFFTIKKWKQRRDPFPASITLGGFIGAVSLLCHCLVEFNLHIPSNAFLLFVILGLIMVAVNLKVRGEEESSLLPAHSHFLSPKIRTAIVMVTAIVVVFLLALVLKDYLGYRFFISREQGERIEDRGLKIKELVPRPSPLEPSSSNLLPRSSLLAPRSSLLVPLTRAIFFDSGNASYRYELGNYYAQKMSESWKQGAWNLQGERWVFDAEKNTRFFGLKALQAYAVAVNLCPANAWYHFYIGWTLSELKRFSDFSHNPIQLAEPLDAEIEFSRALMLDPNNEDIKKYVKNVKRKGIKD